MKLFFLGMLLMLFLVLLLFVSLNRVGRDPRHQATSPDELYSYWLEKSAQLAAVAPADAAQQDEWVSQVKTAFSPFSVENVKEHFPKAYAEEFYFRDAFHSFTERDEMVAYMVASAEMSPGVTFTFSPVVRDGIDFYLPWVMELPGKKIDGGQRSLGISHLRFNQSGQVIFHQDYWDSADVLVPKVPVANGLIELVRRRF